MVNEPVLSNEDCIVDGLRCISAGQQIILYPTDGIETIAQSPLVFPGYLSSDFKNWGLDVSSMPTGITNVQVCDINKDTKLKDLFCSGKIDLKKRHFEQSQIVEFCRNKKYCGWLRNYGFSTFFPFSADNELFWARVRRHNGPLGVCPFRFSDNLFLEAMHLHRVVLPM